MCPQMPTHALRWESRKSNILKSSHSENEKVRPEQSKHIMVFDMLKFVLIIYFKLCHFIITILNIIKRHIILM